MGIYPEAARERFRDMPIIGKWRIDVKSLQGFHPALGPAGHSTLIATLSNDDTFVGELLCIARRLPDCWGRSAVE